MVEVIVAAQGETVLQLVVVGVKVKVQLGLVVEVVDLDLLFAFLRFFERKVRVFQAIYC